ncbi:MAG: hypothetical protein IJB97_05540 [Clostridia bacterium]|nr:hypothetical protein [Clostridia bacterium]
MEDYSLRIENLLCELSPEMKGMRAIIAQSPYEEIVRVLTGRVSIKTLENFQMRYQGIKNKSIAELKENGYDFKILISDLANIVREVKK